MAGIFENITKRIFGGPSPERASPTENLGSIGDVIDDAGYIISVERSPLMQGRQKYVRYSEILTNTTIVATGVRYFLLLLSASEWTVEPPKDEDGEPIPGAAEVADFIKDVIHDMKTPWTRVVRRAALYRFHGFSLQEWTAKQREDGRLGLANIQARPQNTVERWDMEDGEVLGVVQFLEQSTPNSDAGEIYLPRDKLIYVVDDSLHESPEGLGLFRHIVRPAERLRAYEELEELAFETDLRGTPVGRAPLTELREAVNNKSLTNAQALKARSAVDAFVRNKLRNKNKGLMLNSETYRNLDEASTPSSIRKYDVELMRGDANGQTEVAASIQRQNQEIARLLGVEHLMLGSDGTGSLALGQTKLSNFFLTVTSTQEDLAEAFNRDIVNVVCELNGIPKELWPKLSPEELDMTDVTALGALLSDIASAGAPIEPGDPAVDVIRARVGLPPAPEVEESTLEEDAMLASLLNPAMNPALNPALNPGAAPAVDPNVEPEEELEG